MQETKLIVEKLNIPCYYSNLNNKDIILNDFINNNNTKAIVETNAIRVRLDIKTIKYLIHPYLINNFINLN